MLILKMITKMTHVPPTFSPHFHNKTVEILDIFHYFAFRQRRAARNLIAEITIVARDWLVGGA